MLTARRVDKNITFIHAEDPTMIRRLSAALVLLVFFSLPGCDSNEPEELSPNVLSADVFTLDTGIFNNTTPAKSQAGPNFVAAAFRVWPVSVVLGAHLILPAAVTNAALQADPVFENGSWIWESTATFNNDGVTFTLEATPRTNGHDWSSRVSYIDVQSQQQIDNHELYTARTQNQGTEGSWSLYYRIEGASVNVLDADFVRNSETDKTLTFSVPLTAAQNPGDSVTYTVNGDLRSFHWVQVDAGIDHMIRWNAVTRAGSITATNYNNGDEACWDGDGNDMACAI
jgi:hypothetical protein